MAGTLFTFVVLEGWQQSVEVDLVSGQNAELVLRAWIERHGDEVALALEFEVLSDQEFLVLDIIDGNGEIGKTANHDQIVAIAREGHTEALESGAHLEFSDGSLGGHGVDLAAWLETRLGGSDQVVVVA